MTQHDDPEAPPRQYVPGHHLDRTMNEQGLATRAANVEETESEHTQG